MDEKRIYKLSLLLPIAFPFLFWLVIPRDSSSLPEWIATILLTVVWSGKIGAIPYSVVAILLLIWMWNKKPRSIRKVLLLSPVLMMVAFIPFAAGFIILSADSSLPTSELKIVGYFLLIFSGYILVIGYSYVFLTLAIARIFRKKTLENLPE